jgi:hypothetical protein
VPKAKRETPVRVATTAHPKTPLAAASRPHQAPAAASRAARVGQHTLTADPEGGRARLHRAAPALRPTLSSPASFAAEGAGCASTRLLAAQLHERRIRPATVGVGRQPTRRDIRCPECDAGKLPSGPGPCSDASTKSAAKPGFVYSHRAQSRDSRA